MFTCEVEVFDTMSHKCNIYIDEFSAVRDTYAYNNIRQQLQIVEPKLVVIGAEV
jgi:hypothetical protein